MQINNLKKILLRSKFYSVVRISYTRKEKLISWKLMFKYSSYAIFNDYTQSFIIMLCRYKLCNTNMRTLPSKIVRFYILIICIVQWEFRKSLNFTQKSKYISKYSYCCLVFDFNYDEYYKWNRSS